MQPASCLLFFLYTRTRGDLMVTALVTLDQAVRVQALAGDIVLYS